MRAESSPLDPSTEPAAVEALLGAVAALQPDLPATAVTLKRDPDQAAVLALGREGVVYVDPQRHVVTGQGSSAARGTMRTVTELHRYLGAAAERRPLGKAVTGAANLVFLFVLLSGLYLWVPRVIDRARLRNVVWFRRGLNPKARDLNWHHVLGLWAWIPLVLIVVSALPISYLWAGDLLLRITGSPVPPRAASPSAPPSATAPGARSDAPAAGLAAMDLHGLDRAVERAVADAPAWRSITLRLPPSRDGKVNVTVDRSRSPRPPRPARAARRRSRVRRADRERGLRRSEPGPARPLLDALDPHRRGGRPRGSDRRGWCLRRGARSRLDRFRARTATLRRLAPARRRSFNPQLTRDSERKSTHDEEVQEVAPSFRRHVTHGSPMDGGRRDRGDVSSEHERRGGATGRSEPVRSHAEAVVDRSSYLADPGYLWDPASSWNVLTGDQVRMASADGFEPEDPAAAADRKSTPPRIRFDIAGGRLAAVLEAYSAATGVKVELAEAALGEIESRGCGRDLHARRSAQPHPRRHRRRASLPRREERPRRPARRRERGDRRRRSRRRVHSPKQTEPLLDTPQSITVVDAELIQAQGATTLRDVLRNVTGISIQAGEGGGGLPGDNLAIRGFAARNDIFVDGVRDFGAYSRDSYNIEQVEVSKGPASVFGGRGSTGGAHQPGDQGARPRERRRRASVAAGTDDFQRATLDLNRPLPDGMMGGSALRLNVMYTAGRHPGPRRGRGRALRRRAVARARARWARRACG